jgi:hypothetical protein
MGKSANLRRLEAPKTVWLIGGCHGTCIFHTSDDEAGRRSQRQFLFANCIVLTLCAAIVAFVVALVWA